MAEVYFVFFCPEKGYALSVRFGYLATEPSDDNPFSACTIRFPISDHVIFSWEFSFCLFTTYAYIRTCIRRHLKETILWSSITWPEMGKQNVEAEKVYYLLVSRQILA